MPLLVTTLAAAIQKFTDPDFEGFEGFPEDDAAAAAAWAAAIDTYTGAGANIVPPSTTGVVARGALETALLGLSAPGAAIALFDVAFAAYATSLAGGMAPAFTATPPPALLSNTPPTIAAVFAAGVAGADGATQAAAMALLIDTWFRTGTATPSSGGSPAPWS